MNECKITSTNDNIENELVIEVRGTPLYIKPSDFDHTSPEMYNYAGEQLFFVEVPYEALVVGGIEQAAEVGRKYLTLAKMEKNIAAAGKSHKINPAYGIETAKVESFTFKMKDGQTITATPQDNQYRFHSNKGVTKILGILENTGNILDFVNILKWGMDSSDKKELLPLPGPLSVLNLPMKDYFDNLDKAINDNAINEVNRSKDQGIVSVKKVISYNIQKKIGYSLIAVSNETVKRILSNEITIIEEVIDAYYTSESNDGFILYRRTDHHSGCIAIIETFFFKLD